MAECEAVRHIIAAVDDPQYTKDALEAAGERQFWERFETELGAIQAGQYENKSEFEYAEIVNITDQEPLTT